MRVERLLVVSVVQVSIFVLYFQFPQMSQMQSSNFLITFSFINLIQCFTVVVIELSACNACHMSFVSMLSAVRTIVQNAQMNILTV